MARGTDHRLPAGLDWDEEEARLTISSVPGIPASDLSDHDLTTAWPSLVEMIGALHRLDPQDCPFDRGVHFMLARARDVVARGAVNPDFLCAADKLVGPTTLLAQVEVAASAPLGVEAREIVVCHGNATMPNLMVDPINLRCTGFDPLTWG